MLRVRNEGPAPEYPPRRWGGRGALSPVRPVRVSGTLWWAAGSSGWSRCGPPSKSSSGSWNPARLRPEGSPTWGRAPDLQTVRVGRRRRYWTSDPTVPTSPEGSGAHAVRVRIRCGSSRGSWDFCTSAAPGRIAPGSRRPPRRSLPSPSHNGDAPAARAAHRPRARRGAIERAWTAAVAEGRLPALDPVTPPAIEVERPRTPPSHVATNRAMSWPAAAPFAIEIAETLAASLASCARSG